mmetsp:Transcript_9376/g.15431  ORF Transcript_9376/g.15431 Transcript_9376/m.15431 type:complete len:356 (-) Transcript_9376:907-1974(-)|eukprot:CAMPEP_0184654046 /NCGR_PEP_ID=MMETSP0308-20130426/11750_1 /TAXON_ID=38269 /ORGANISM="Gloeochaete witrockiana, Strain SAG 46.84" /LENGTH=355 /DNA_ID=CAMNT_0027089843 /DNA_START=35 /DNA_END=1102 /DNA_ORIENTATION=+
MLWVDKYRPAALEKLDYHSHVSEQLKHLVASGDIPHILMYGPSGAGKKTRVIALLREIYGSGVEKLKVEHRIFKFQNSSTAVELTTVSSNYHIEINPGDAGNADRLVVQEVIKEIAQSQPVNATTGRGFKVVVLNEVDRLSKEAQHALRRTMEKYMGTCRIVLVCNSASKVIEPVRSRCLAIRIPAPSLQEVCLVLQQVAKKESIQLSEKLAERMALASERNLRRALLILESSRVQQYPFSDDQQIPPTDWEKYISDIARDILEEQTPARLLAVRGKFYDLLSNCVPADMIIKKLMLELMRTMDSELKHEVAQWAAFYEHRLQLGNKPIFHLEAFTAKVMSIYKRFLVISLGAMD